MMAGDRRAHLAEPSAFPAIKPLEEADHIKV